MRAAIFYPIISRSNGPILPVSDRYVDSDRNVVIFKIYANLRNSIEMSDNHNDKILNSSLELPISLLIGLGT